MRDTINKLNEMLTFEKIHNCNKYEDHIFDNYNIILDSLSKGYDIYRDNIASMITSLESNDEKALYYSLSIFFKLYDAIISRNNYTKFDTSILQNTISDETFEKFKDCLNSSCKENNKIRISDYNFHSSTLNNQDKKEIVSFLISKLECDAITYEWSPELIESYLINFAVLRALLNDLKDSNLFYFSFGIFIDRLTTSEYFQSSRDVVEELLIAAFKDGNPEYGFFNIYRCYSNQESIHAAILYANLSMIAALKKGGSYLDKYIQELIWQSMKYFRGTGLFHHGVEIYNKIPANLFTHDYDIRSIDHTYFTILLKATDERLPDLLLDYLNKNREAIIKGGAQDCQTWLITLNNVKRIYKNAKFTTQGLGFYLNIFEQIVPEENIARYKDIIWGNSSKLKEELKKSIVKLNQTRNKIDLVYDNAMPLKISNRLIDYSFKNKDFEAILLAMMLKSDYSLIYKNKESSNLIRFTLPNLHKAKLEQQYENADAIFETICNINDNEIMLWLAEDEGKLYQLSRFNNRFLYSKLRNWSNLKFSKLLTEDYFSNLAFNDTAKDKGGVYEVSFEEHLQEEIEILAKLDISQIEIPQDSTSILLVKDMKLSKFPHNLFINQNREYIYIERPIANILSTEWYLSREKNSILEKKYTKSIWIPTEGGDFSLNKIFSSLESCLEEHSFSINTSVEIKNKLNSDINIISSHGAKNISQVQVIYPDGNPLRNLNKIIGSGKILIFFVCYSGTMTNDFFRNQISSLVKEYISQGYEAVIAPTWALHINIPPIWLPVFLKAIDEGFNLNSAVHKANMAIRDKYPTPAAWACLHLFGNPNITIN